MYSPQPTAQELADFGVTAEDFAGADFDVWPCCWRSVQFFAAIGPGDWSVGPGGPIGIRAEVFREIRLATGVTEEEWPAMFSDVRVMENAAVELMAQQAKIRDEMRRSTHGR